MKIAFEETLETLAERRKEYQEQINGILGFERLLTRLWIEPSVGIANLPLWAKFEVHFCARGLCHRNVNVTGRSLSKTYDRAVALWKEYNGEDSNPGSASVFISQEKMLLVISPVDAAWIANNETYRPFHPGQFTYDSRLLEEVGRTIWPPEEWGWHSCNPVVLENEPKDPVSA